MIIINVSLNPVDLERARENVDKSIYRKELIGMITTVEGNRKIFDVSVLVVDTSEIEEGDAS